jgi:hypothetical protein
MPSCPHIDQDNHDREIKGSYPLITYCRGGCDRTVFFCPKCGEANRPLARFCRSCGGKISFDTSVADFLASGHLPGKWGEARSYPLSQAKEILWIESYRGHLFITTSHKIIIYDLHRLGRPLKELPSPDDNILRGITIFSSEKAGQPGDEELFVTTTKALYRYSLLNLDTPKTLVYQLDDPNWVIHHQALVCRGELYLLTYNQSERLSRLARHTGEVVKEFKGHSLPPLAINGDAIFFGVEKQIFLFNGQATAEGEIREPLDQEAKPAYSREMNQIYLVGKKGLWRVDLQEGRLTAASLSATISGAARIAADEDHLFVADANGFALLDPFGEKKWDSGQSYIKASSDGYAPQLDQHHVIFTAIGRFGGSEVRIHLGRNPKDFEPVIFDKRLLCPPALSLGKLIAVVGDGNSATLELRQAAQQ